MWINMEKRAFRLNGNAKNTKVGDLHIETCHGSSSNCSGVLFFFVLFALAGCSDRRLRLEKTIGFF